jgi:hypothetical protein
MPITRWWPVLTWFALLAAAFPAIAWVAPSPAPGLPQAVDLTRVERTIAREPVYQSKEPAYCLLVFGPRAETRVWLVLDVVSRPTESDGSKNALYVDRNGNGDLTEPGKVVRCSMKKAQHWFSFSKEPSVTYSPHFEAGTIVERDGKTRHLDLTVEVRSYMQDYRPCSLSLKVNGRGLQTAGGRLRLGTRPQDAPIIHFNGPLTLRTRMETGVMFVPISYEEDSARRRRWYADNPPTYEQAALSRGKKSTLYAQLGTPGLGRGTFVAHSVAGVHLDAHPVVEVVFPKETGAKVATRSRVVLDGRC